MTTVTDVLNNLATHWRINCRAVDQYREQGDLDLAHLRTAEFDSWLEGYASALLMTDEIEAYNTTNEARILWIYRSGITPAPARRAA